MSGRTQLIAESGIHWNFWLPRTSVGANFGLRILSEESASQRADAALVARSLPGGVMLVSRRNVDASLNPT